MTKSISIFGYEIESVLTWHGSDILVEITGGSRPHIGSISTCWFENGKQILTKHVLPKHKDYVVGDMFAWEIASMSGVTVCVVCGIHYDNLSKDEIFQIVEAMKTVLISFQNELIPPFLESK